MKTTEPSVNVNSINDIIHEIDICILRLVDEEGVLLENHKQAMTLTKMLGDLTKAVDALLEGDASILNVAMKKYEVKEKKINESDKMQYMLVPGEYSYAHLKEVITRLYQVLHAKL